MTELFKCHTCKEEKTREHFHSHKLRPKGVSCYCKDCANMHSKELARLHKIAPEKPDACECCGATDRKLLLDHCHETLAFRGWICGKCNTGLGSLGDTLDDVKNALNYLQNFEDNPYVAPQMNLW